MATAPQFISTPRIATANTATANTAIDGTGTITPVIQGAATGTRVLEVVVQSTATTVSAYVGLFLSTDGGTTWTLFDTLVVSARTVSTAGNGAPIRVSRSYANLLLADSSHGLGFTTTIAQGTSVIVLGGDL